MIVGDIISNRLQQYLLQADIARFLSYLRYYVRNLNFSKIFAFTRNAFLADNNETLSRLRYFPILFH